MISKLKTQLLWRLNQHLMQQIRRQLYETLLYNHVLKIATNELYTLKFQSLNKSRICNKQYAANVVNIYIWLDYPSTIRF